MTILGIFTVYLYFVQLAHSTEEIVTGFHKQWYLFSMPFWVFFTFELLHNIFWGLVIFTNSIPYKAPLLVFFTVLMFANGVQHIVWWGSQKKYVPGLITAPFHITLFLILYFRLVSSQ